MQLFKDGTSSGGPPEGLSVLVVSGDEVVDAVHELFDAGERTAPNGFVNDHLEEALNLIEPRAVARNEVHMSARVRSKPCFQFSSRYLRF